MLLYVLMYVFFYPEPLAKQTDMQAITTVKTTMQ